MKYGVAFLLNAGCFLAIAFWLGATLPRAVGIPLAVGIAWLAIDFVWVAIAYFGLGAGAFGKRSDGTLSLLAIVALAPYLLLTWGLWHVVRLASRGDAWQRVTDRLIVGRRLLSYELPNDVMTVVDLTAEFVEPRAIRDGRRYLAFPMIDAGTADAEAFATFVRQIAVSEGVTYLHCAMGHGRTGTMAAAILVAAGEESTAERAVERLRRLRPGLALHERQREFLEEICAKFATDDHSL
jgi:protein-tyrosine phosphatase